MNKLVYSPVVKEKLVAIHAYIAGNLASPIAARKTVNAIRKHLQILINNPEIGPRLSSHYDAVPTRFKETRFLVCGKYIAIYDYEAPLVKVIELYHGSQDYISSLFS